MNIIDIPSPNLSRGRKGYHPEAIVIHIMEGTLSGTDSWFKNKQSKVSAHYGIGKLGEVHRYVPEADTAWHAGRVHSPEWTGIKPSGTGSYINPNYYTIGIEHEGTADSTWEPALYDASAELIADICKRWNIPIDRKYIVGHHEIFSVKTCPGFKVDLQNLVDLAKQSASYVQSTDITEESGTVTTTTSLRLRKHAPSTKSPVVRTVPERTTLEYVKSTNKGELVKGNSNWYQTKEGYWFWGGGVTVPTKLIHFPPQPINYKDLFKNFGTDGIGIKIGILDQGFYQHDAFRNEVKAIFDFTIVNGNAEDKRGHGTHVAGIIGARLQDASLPVLGVAPEGQLIVGKVVSDQKGDVNFIVKGIDWAINNKVKVLNLSFGVEDSLAPLLKPAIKRASDSGIIIVAAAGSVKELDRGHVQYPAADSDNCISVATVSKTYLASNPSLNPAINFLSGYSYCLSTSIPQYNYYKAEIGSSMATAFVSGLIARILSKWKSEGRDIVPIQRTEIMAELYKICVERNNLNFNDYSPFRISK